MDDHVDLDADHPPQEPVGVAPVEMMDICTRMMRQTQQILQQMAKDRAEEKKQKKRDDQYRLEQDKARLDLEHQLELERQEERRQMRELQERLEGQRLADLQQAREEARRRREADEHKARLKAIQMPPPMSNRTDLREYLELFQRTAQRKEMREEDWAPTLVSLLNEKFRGTAVKLPPGIRDDFAQLREALLERDDAHTKNAASTFWTLPKRKGTTALEHHQMLTRLLYRFADGEDKDSSLDAVVRERLIQDLPKEGRLYVCQRKPRTGIEAAALAEEFFQNSEDSYASWSSEQAEPRVPTYSGKDKQPYGRWRDGPQRQRGRDKPPQGEEHDNADTTMPEDTQETEVEAQVEREHKKPTGPRGQRWNPWSGRCYRCGEQGHRQAECTLRVNRIEILSAKRNEKFFRLGKIFNRSVRDILLDSGAETSLVHRSVLPRRWQRTGVMVVAATGGPIFRIPKTMVTVDLGTRQLKLECGVVEDSVISVPLLIGHNLPNVSLLHLMVETVPPEQCDLKDLRNSWERTHKSTSDQTEVEPQSTPEMEEEDSRVTQASEPHISPGEGAQPSEEESNPDHKGDEEESGTPTEETRAAMVPWEEILPMEEEEQPRERNEDMDRENSNCPGDRERDRDKPEFRELDRERSRERTRSRERPQDRYEPRTRKESPLRRRDKSSPDKGKTRQSDPSDEVVPRSTTETDKHRLSLVRTQLDGAGAGDDKGDRTAESEVGGREIATRTTVEVQPLTGHEMDTEAIEVLEEKLQMNKETRTSNTDEKVKEDMPDNNHYVEEEVDECGSGKKKKQFTSGEGRDTKGDQQRERENPRQRPVDKGGTLEMGSDQKSSKIHWSRGRCESEKEEAKANGVELSATKAENTPDTLGPDKTESPSIPHPDGAEGWTGGGGVLGPDPDSGQEHLEDLAVGQLYNLRNAHEYLDRATVIVS